MFEKLTNSVSVIKGQKKTGNLELTGREAVEFVKKYAAEGHPELLELLEKYDVSEDGRVQNVSSFVEDLRKSAEAGDVHAMCSLGSVYQNGDLNDPDAAEAMKWFGKAALKGCAEAQYALGLLYKEGEGVSPDPGLAFYWFRQAAGNGDVNAEIAVAASYYAGEGVEQSLEKAVEWNLRAAEHNHPQAQYNAGVLYMSGEGVKQDFQQAMYWERLARMNALRTSVNIS